MRLKILSTSLLAVALLVSAVNVALGGDHAPWPSDWNNWNDPALWATVGNPGNNPDTRYNNISVGAVSYSYKIGKFEVTAGQYTAFLNAMAKTDTYGLYNAHMWSNGECKIQQSGSSGSYTYSVASDYANRPVSYVSWGDAARFCNWLSNGKPSGAQVASTTEDGSYYLNGATSNSDLMTVIRKANATFVIPTEDEWYKAAYYKGGGTNAGYWDYPTGTNSVPSNLLTSPDPGNNANFYFYQSGYTIGYPYGRTEVGAFTNSASPYGTFDQSGNVSEWDETKVSGERGLRGGSFDCVSTFLAASDRYYYSPQSEIGDMGFRVAYVPEPGSIVMLLSIIVCGLMYWNRRKA
ncbi:MAG: SUMF1/EgtB/PvdO family nonheme iron enzyme [Thermoguttaceae bacterium]